MNQRTIRLTIALTATFVLLSAPASPRTWYVNISGTGDAPTIEAALDSAVWGDTVLVGPGTYETETGYTVGAGVVVMSELGPQQTRATGVGPTPPPGIFALSSHSELHGFWAEDAVVATVFTGNDCLVRGNIIRGPGYNIDIQHQTATVTNNLFLAGQGIYRGVGALFTNNIVYCRFYCEGDPPTAYCNNILSPDSPCLQLLLQLYGVVNFSLDPQFCGIEASDYYYLQSDSPCAPGNSPIALCEDLVGPLPVGCGTVDTEIRSWGAIKSMYRE